MTGVEKRKMIPTKNVTVLDIYNDTGDRGTLSAVFKEWLLAMTK